MNNRIIKVTKRQPVTQAIVFSGTEAGVSDIKTHLAPAKVHVCYVGRNEWHPMLNSAEQAGEYYYDPFLVLTPHQGKPVRVEAGDIIVVEDRNAFSVYSPSMFGEYYDFIPEVSDLPGDETDEETPIVDPEDDTEVVEETIEEEVLISDEQHDDPTVEFDNGAIDGVAGDHPEVSG